MKSKRWIGLGLVFFGVILLVGLHFLSFPSVAAIIFSLVIAIIMGLLTYAYFQPKEERWKLKERFGSLIKRRERLKSTAKCREKAKEFLREEAHIIREEEGHKWKVDNMIGSPAKDRSPVVTFQLVPAATHGEFPEKVLKSKRRTVSVDRKNLDILSFDPEGMEFYDPKNPEKKTAVSLWEKIRRAGRRRREKTAVQEEMEKEYKKKIGEYLAERDIKEGEEVGLNEQS